MLSYTTSTFSTLFLSVFLIFARRTSTAGNTSGANITSGNCAKAILEDRAFFDNVDRVGVPLLVQTQSEVYYGDPEIYCIIVANNKRLDDSPGFAKIIEGGVGDTHATITLSTDRGAGMSFNVSIYAKAKNIKV